MLRVSSYRDCRDAYRHRDLRQGLYDEGVALMGDVIVNLHGEAHRDRRRLENRLFRRDVFMYFEREVIPEIVERVLAPAVEAGRGDLVILARRAMLITPPYVDDRIGVRADAGRRALDAAREPGRVGPTT